MHLLRFLRHFNILSPFILMAEWESDFQVAIVAHGLPRSRRLTEDFKFNARLNL